MKYLFGIIFAILIGILGGWSIYNSCAGSKKDRLFAGIIWTFRWYYLGRGYCDYFYSRRIWGLTDRRKCSIINTESEGINNG